MIMLMTCPLCLLPMDKRFAARDYRRPADQTEWQLLWCDPCAYGCIDGQFSPATVASFYTIPYYTHQPGGLAKAADSQRSFLDRLRVHLAWRADFGYEFSPQEVSSPRGANPSICDLGCGGGAHLAVFQKAGYNGLGVEPDPLARAAAQQIAHVLDGTAEHLPQAIQDMRFDVVLLSHVLEHCIHPLNALRNARQLLSADGTVVIEVPNHSALGFALFEAMWPWTDIPRHLHFFTAKSLEAALHQAGLEVTQTHYHGYTRQFQPEWIAAQHEIWEQLGSGPAPDYRRASWGLLLRSWLAPTPLKYDSLRVHAKAI